MNPLKFCDSSDPQLFYSFLYGMCHGSADYYTNVFYFFHPCSEWVTIDKVRHRAAIIDMLETYIIYS